MKKKEMGFFTRLLGIAQKDEEEEEEGEIERPIHPDTCCKETSKRVGKLWMLSISIYKAIKGLVRKISSIFFYHAHPLLPLQNPASTTSISTEPLLISSPTTFDDEDSVCEDRLLWCQDEFYWCQTVDHRVVVSDMRSVLVEENASTFLEETTEEDDEDEDEDEDKDENEEEEEELKSVILVVEERWIKHYSSGHRMLLVGEGNFSFSACLAKAFRCASNIIATSLDSQAFLKEHYVKALSNIEELRSRGSKVLHGIDATTMANHHLLRHLKFDRIVYNFPYAGLQAIKSLPRQTQLEHHRRLVRQFLENAREMISEEGEIHITHKTNGFHAEWRLVSLACGRGLRLRLIEAVHFKHRDYPGYNTKCGFGGNKHFHCYPCKTYKFGLNSH